MQIDGNISLTDDDTDSMLLSHQKIQSHYGFRPPNMQHPRLPPVRKICNSDTNIIQSIPIISVYNARSLFPKINSLATDMHERKTDVKFISEIWEKFEKKKHQQKIEELFELKGIKYGSNPRRNGKRGGGAALAVNLERFAITKLNIHVPKNVEAVWALLRPKFYSKKLKLIIVCCFYSPPNLRTNPSLIDHLTLSLNNLLNIHKNAGNLSRRSESYKRFIIISNRTITTSNRNPTNTRQ